MPSVIAVLDEEVLGVLREERGSGHPDGRGTVGPDDGEGFLKESDPVHEVSVVLDVLDTDEVAMESAFSICGARNRSSGYIIADLPLHSGGLMMALTTNFKSLELMHSFNCL